MELSLRHALATLAYRLGKVMRGAPADFGTWPGAGDKTPVAILAHIGDLMDWAVTLVEGRQAWHNSEPLRWTEEVARCYESIAAFDAALATAAPDATTAEKLFQGPIADALTHTGQLAMLRRLAGCPMKGENYAVAEIVAGRVGAEQPDPRREF